MRSSTRLIVNTGAQYTRTIVNLVLSLYSTRLILHALGVDDYGIFTLIAGVVSMLAFMTNAMVSTTQRFMSYHQTKSNLPTQQKIFGNSVLMHLLFSVIVFFILEIVGLFLFEGFLNIPDSRIGVAKTVYQCAIAMVLCSFVTSPFMALLISHENLVYISIIEVLDGVLKVGVAIFLTVISYDKLVIYGYLMIGIYLVNLITFAVYDFKKYQECVLPRLHNLDKEYIKSMSTFIGWQMYSTGCIVARTQGTAVIVNRFFGTAINAAFGIALQVSGAVSFVSSALLTSINPQIVKAEGSGNRKKMFGLAESASKLSFLLLAMIVIPVLFVLPELLQVWLGEIPDGSILFCQVILLTALIDQITLGLGTANQAIGNIGYYSRIINTIKVMTLPCLWILLKAGVQLDIAIWCYAAIELICALCRLPFLKYNGGLNITNFVRNVFYKLPCPCLFLIISYVSISQCNLNIILYIIYCLPISIIYGIIVFKWSLNRNEKENVMLLFSSVYKKLINKNIL